MRLVCATLFRREKGERISENSSRERTIDVTSELAMSNDSFVLGVSEFRVSLRVHL